MRWWDTFREKKKAKYKTSRIVTGMEFLALDREDTMNMIYFPFKKIIGERVRRKGESSEKFSKYSLALHYSLLPRLR